MEKSAKPENENIRSDFGKNSNPINGKNVRRQIAPQLRKYQVRSGRSGYFGETASEAKR